MHIRDSNHQSNSRLSTGAPAADGLQDVNGPDTSLRRLSHLQRLEAESIFIMLEVVAECERPVMLYSVGKDSAVMVHLAMKAFHFPQDRAWRGIRTVCALRETVQNVSPGTSRSKEFCGICSRRPAN